MAEDGGQMTEGGQTRSVWRVVEQVTVEQEKDGGI
jgi:hypothetical protein